MPREDYEVVIGLEVHSELSTKTKIFCSCPTEFGGDPNTHTCQNLIRFHNLINHFVNMDM